MRDVTFVIVGASLAGGSAALALREAGFEGRLVLVGEEPHPPYERPPLSKAYLRGEQGFEKMLLRPRDLYESKEIDTLFGVRATRLDPTGRVVELAGGGSIAFDKALIATGGRNRRLRVPGAELEGIYQLRTVDEADRIREEIAPGRKAVVVGMGFIGCEVAASLRRRGVEVTAVEPMKGPLAPVLGQEVSRVIEAIHRDQGVEMIFGEAVAAFEGDDRVERVVTNGGRAIDCGFAVVGVGIEPEAGLVDGTGIEVSNGIVVDEHCRTSVEGVFAAGDVANHYHPVFRRRLRVEHYQNAINQGRAAAKAMLGSPEPYDDVHWFWSDQYDDNLQYAGYHREWDDLVVRGSLEQRRFVAFYLKDGLVLAAVGLNNGRDLRRSIPLIKAGSPVERARLADGEVDLRTLAR